MIGSLECVLIFDFSELGNTPTHFMGIAGHDAAAIGPATGAAITGPRKYHDWFECVNIR